MQQALYLLSFNLLNISWWDVGVSVLIIAITIGIFHLRNIKTIEFEEIEYKPNEERITDYVGSIHSESRYRYVALFYRIYLQMQFYLASAIAAFLVFSAGDLLKFSVSGSTATVCYGLFIYAERKILKKKLKEVGYKFTEVRKYLRCIQQKS